MIRLLITLIIITGSLFLTNVNAATNMSTTSNTQAVYRHIVLFNFKDTATKEQIQEIITAFKALPSKIKEIKGFEWGTQTSPENLTAGMTHCFLVTFDNAKGLEAYLPHPEHKKFVALVGPLLEGKPIVADYITKDVYEK